MNHSNRNILTPIPITSSDNDTYKRLTSPTKISPIQTSLPIPKTLNLQRPRISSTYSDKYSHSLRDFPLNHFDRHLTVEKATFDPVHSHVPSQQQTSSLNVPALSNTSTSTIGISSTLANNQDLSISIDTRSPTMGSPTPIHLLHLQDDTPLPSSSSSSSSKIPEKSLTAAAKRQDTQFSHSPPRSIITKMKPPPLPKPKRCRSNKKKKRTLPPVNGTATPSEVFHRNLVDAVSNVEDSDENEQYVYPYSHHDTAASSITSSKKQPTKRHFMPGSFRRPRPSINSAPGSFLSLQQGGMLSNLVSGTHQSMSSLFKWVTNEPETPHPQDEEDWIRPHRPKLRNYVMDHPRSSTTQSFPHAWAHEFSSSDDDEEDDDDDDDDNDSKDEYDTDRYGERASLLRPRKRRHHHRHQTSLLCRILRNTCISLFIFILIMVILTVYRAEPLTDLTASMNHILASDKELIFDLQIQANNWNWWTVRIQDADLSIFAFNDLLLNTTTTTTTTTTSDANGVDPAEYLGACQLLDQPLSFTSSVLLPQHERASTSSSIKIKSPGADPSGNQRWSRMIRSPFGLVTRGVIKYRPFPLFRLSPQQSILLCVVTHVDPALASLDDDHGYCSHYLIPSFDI